MISYPAAYARMRALKGYLFAREQMELMAQAPDVKTVISLLESTTYASEISEYRIDPESYSSASQLEHALKQNLITSYAKILTFLRGRSYKFLETWLRKYELYNVKSIVRYITQKAYSDIDISSLIFSLGKYHEIPVQKAIEAEDIEDLIQILANTSFERPLQLGYQQYLNTNNIFPLEMALDISYYERLWYAFDSLGPLDKKGARPLLGMYYDITNLMWIFRFRTFTTLTPEQIFQYTIPHGWRIRGEVLIEIIRSDTINSMSLKGLEPFESVLGSFDQTQDGALLLLKATLLRHLYKQCVKTMLDFPLQIALLISFFLMKEMEISDIVTIINAKYLDMPQEQIKPYLITVAK